MLKEIDFLMGVLNHPELMPLRNSFDSIVIKRLKQRIDKLKEEREYQ